MSSIISCIRFPGLHGVSEVGVIVLITYICGTFYIFNLGPMLIVLTNRQNKLVGQAYLHFLLEETGPSLKCLPQDYILRVLLLLIHE